MYFLVRILFHELLQGSLGPQHSIQRIRTQKLATSKIDRNLHVNSRAKATYSYAIV